MSDNRWIPPNKRNNLVVHDGSLRHTYEMALLDHAALCDELITELAEALRDCMEAINTWSDYTRGESWLMALSRVDGLTKGTT